MRYKHQPARTVTEAMLANMKNKAKGVIFQLLRVAEIYRRSRDPAPRGPGSPDQDQTDQCDSHHEDSGQPEIGNEAVVRDALHQDLREGLGDGPPAQQGDEKQGGHPLHDRFV